MDLLLEHQKKFDEVFNLKTLNFVTSSYRQQKQKPPPPPPKHIVKSLQELSDNLTNINDDDPGLLNYLRNQKIDYPDFSIPRHIGQPELGQVSVSQ